jgi:hypothetical protein
MLCSSRRVEKFLLHTTCRSRTTTLGSSSPLLPLQLTSHPRVRGLLESRRTPAYPAGLIGNTTNNSISGYSPEAAQFV